MLALLLGIDREKQLQVLLSRGLLRHDRQLRIGKYRCARRCEIDALLLSDLLLKPRDKLRPRDCM